MTSRLVVALTVLLLTQSLIAESVYTPEQRILDDAKKSTDPKICDPLKPQQYKSLCLYRVARNSGAWNMEFCGTLAHEYTKDECYLDLAIEKLDMSACKHVTETFAKTVCTGIEKRDVHVCKLDPTRDGECSVAVARGLRDSKVCHNLPNKNFFGTCKTAVALQTAQPSDCQDFDTSCLLQVFKRVPPNKLTPDLCKGVYDFPDRPTINKADTPKSRCEVALAVQLQSVAHCPRGRGYTDDSTFLYKECLKKVSARKDEYKKCEENTDPGNRQTCLNELATRDF